MMFVDADAVESQLIGKLQFVQITVVQRVAELWIVQGIRTSHPGGFVRLGKILRQIRPRHQMKAIDLHQFLTDSLDLLNGLNDLNS